MTLPTRKTPFYRTLAGEVPDGGASGAEDTIRFRPQSPPSALCHARTRGSLARFPADRRLAPTPSSRPTTTSRTRASRIRAASPTVSRRSARCWDSMSRRSRPAASSKWRAATARTSCPLPPRCRTRRSSDSISRREPIARAQRMARDLGLANIQLRQLDLRDMPRGPGNLRLHHRARALFVDSGGRSRQRPAADRAPSCAERRRLRELQHAARMPHAPRRVGNAQVPHARHSGHAGQGRCRARVHRARRRAGRGRKSGAKRRCARRYVTQARASTRDWRTTT